MDFGNPLPNFPANLNEITSYEEVTGCQPQEATLRGLIVFYLNVGQLSPEKVQIYAEGMKEKVFRPELSQKLVALGYEVIVLSTRETPTRIEVVPL